MRSWMLAAVVLAATAYFAWDNPCYSEAVSFQRIPRDRQSAITLEARRVRAIDGNTITYDLGKETIRIKTDSFTAQRFAKDVKAGRCSAHQKVTLTPERKSPFNKTFRTTNIGR